MQLASDAYIDARILFFASDRFQKVARIFGKVMQECEQKQIVVSAEMLDRRLHFLIAAGRLEAAGNVAEWRFSEVRLAGRAN